MLGKERQRGETENTRIRQNSPFSPSATIAVAAAAAVVVVVVVSLPKDQTATVISWM